jgi:hypothetical protein
VADDSACSSGQATRFILVRQVTGSLAGFALRGGAAVVGGAVTVTAQAADDL